MAASTIPQYGCSTATLRPTRSYAGDNGDLAVSVHSESKENAQEPQVRQEKVHSTSPHFLDTSGMNTEMDALTWGDLCLRAAFSSAIVKIAS